MDDTLPGDWLEDDDIFSIESHTLFRPEVSSFAVDQLSPPNALSSCSSDYYDPISTNEVIMDNSELSLLDGGYISSNSSDSGKHSPSGSESNSEQGSHWVFPPVHSCQAQNTSRCYAKTQNTETYYQEQGQAYTPITPIASPTSNFVVKTAASPPYQVVPPASTKKVLYIVPSSNTSRTTAIPVTTVSSPATYTVANPTVYVKTEPAIPTVYVKSEGSVPPLYIRQGTGTQLQPIPVTTTTAQSIIIARDTEQEEAIRKMEDRKAKNRAAAQASRVKKRTEVEELKRAVGNLTEENDRLRAENTSLRQRLARYERVDEQGAPMRKRMAIAGTLMMAVFMVTVISPISLNSTTNKPASHITNLKHVVPGRVLNTEIIHPTAVNSTTNCANKRFYNSTEAIRLNSDLYEWVDRHEAMGLGVKGKRRLLQKKQKDWLSAVGQIRVNVTETPDINNTKAVKKQPIPKGDRLWRHLDMISVNGGSSRERRERVRKILKADKNGQSAYNKKTYEKLTSAIQQKEDTLYVVALEDYFLLPALERNVTSQPKVTLILPALSYNSTVTGKVSLMRIDLRVVGTGLFQLSRQLLPLFLQ